MQETQVPSLIREDFTCWEATKPVYHNYWACVPQLLKPRSPRACALQQEKPLHWEAQALQLESSPRWPQLEKSLQAATKTQCSQKQTNKQINMIKKEKRKDALWSSDSGILLQDLGTFCFLYPYLFTQQRLGCLLRSLVSWPTARVKTDSKSCPRGPCILMEGERQLE